MITITLFSTVDQIGGFVYTIILSRAIGAEGIGMYQVAINLVSLAVALSASGLPFVLGRRVAEFDALGNSEGQHASTTAALLVGLSISTATCVFFLLNKNLLVAVTKSEQIATMCLFLLPAAFANSAYACFRGAIWGKKRYVAHSSLEIIDIVIRITIALFVFQGLFTAYTGALRACLAYSTTCVITASVSFLIYRFSGGKFKKPSDHIKPIIKSAVPVSGIRLAGNLFSTVIALLFNSRMTAAGYTLNAAMAEYGILTGMTLPMIAFPVIFTCAISTTLVPEISGNMKKHDVNTVRRHLKKAIDYTMLFGGLAIGVYLSFGRQICTLVFSNPDTGSYVQNACWIMIPLAVSSLTTSLQNSLGLEYKSLVNYFAGAACMLSAVWFLPKFIGAYSLIVGTGIGMTVTALLNIFMICSHVKLNGGFLKTLTSIVAFAALSALSGKLAYNLLLLALTPLSALPIGCLAAVTVYLLLTSVFDTAGVNTLWKNLYFCVDPHSCLNSFRKA